MKNNWEFYGEEIRKTVQDAIDNKDYSKLSQMITDTINQAVDVVADGVRYAADEMRQAVDERQQSSAQRNGTSDGYRHSAEDRKREAEECRRRIDERRRAAEERRRAAEERRRAEYENAARAKSVIRIPSRAGSITAMSIGFAIGGISLFGLLNNLALGFLAQSMLGSGADLLFQIANVFAGIVSAGGIGLGIAGTRRLLKINRGRKYAGIIGQKTYCNITDLAKQAGKSNKFVLKDIEYMIRKRWLKEGHLDKQKICLMITDQMYKEYCHLEEQKVLVEREQREKEEARKQKEAEQKAARGHLSPEVIKIIEQGDVYIRKIRDCNDAIPGEEISGKIDRIEMLVDKIFDRVEQEPRCVSDIQKLMSYYLPTTVKLLEAYAEMDAQPVGGENIAGAKKEIETTIDTLNIAFEKLLDSLFMEKAWDVSSDISVLNTMLAQEGLTEDGLKVDKQ